MYLARADFCNGKGLLPTQMDAGNCTLGSLIDCFGYSAWRSPRPHRLALRAGLLDTNSLSSSANRKRTLPTPLPPPDMVPLGGTCSLTAA